MPQDTAVQKINVRCCIAGGGPAGIVLAYLLARAGIDVLVLEKHADFLRDFRGDTIHPSTLEVLRDLGILEDFLKLPHDELRDIGAQIGDVRATVADFTHLPTHCKFVALMPQWDFLNFMVEHAKRYPEFNLRMQAEVTGLILDGDRVAGVRANTQFGPLEVRAELVIGADGRHSVVREQAGLQVVDIGSPIDVLWMRISRKPGDPVQTLGHVDSGRILVQIQRGDYWQCAFVIPKGGFDPMRERGLPAFREEIARLSPYLRERVGELKSWDDIKLLTVTVDRLKQWYRPGLLCIGDAAHAMSPVGGVGINLAIQDAVAAANILAPAFRRGSMPGAVLLMDALNSEMSPGDSALPEAIAMGLSPAAVGTPGSRIDSSFLRSGLNEHSVPRDGKVSGATAPENRAAPAPEPALSTVTEDDLAAVQRRREFPTRMTQRMQVLIQNRVIGRVLATKEHVAVPWVIKLLIHFPVLRRIPAYIVGMGFRPERVHTPDATSAAPRKVD
ncbi:MAG TPA: FAD-dependent oxidoreductase [Candidatus Acidoferrales bacterium]|nr:FAD-dependent oxidoreductase [Candidatus Acidoferrales bacterium]